jgi:hypothetical protein
LIEANELYIVDYSNSFINPDGTPLQRISPLTGNYLPAPIALFQYDNLNKSLVPYAIQAETDSKAFPGTTMVYFRDISNGWMWR